MESVVKNIAPDTSLYNAAANRAILADTYLNLIKSIVKALAFRQISVLLDIHTLTKNDIGMLWYNDQLSEQTFLQGIDILTQNLCSSEYYNIIGIDLKNEPAWASWGDNNAATDFRAAAARIGNRMLAGCPKWLAFVEGISENHEFTNSAGAKYNFGDWWGAGLARAKQYPVTLSIPDKVVYAPHFYTPAVWPTEAYYGPNYAELTDALLKENVRTMFDIMFGYLAQDASSPAIVLGEFGGLFALDRHPMKTIQRSVRYMVELLMRNGFSGGYVWSLNPESGYDWNPTNTRGFSQEGIVLSDWRYTNEPMLAAFSPLDAMADLKPLRCFT
jgi:endoglucanase